MSRGAEISYEDLVALVTLHKDGKKNSDIAKSLGLKDRAVRKWVKRFKDGGGVEIPTIKKRCGRPKLVSPTTSRAIRRQVVKDPSLTARNLR